MFQWIQFPKEIRKIKVPHATPVQSLADTVFLDCLILVCVMEALLAEFHGERVNISCVAHAKYVAEGF